MLDYVRVFLDWPFLSFLLIGYLLWRYHDAIARLIPNIEQISGPGFQVQIAKQTLAVAVADAREGVADESDEHVDDEGGGYSGANVGDDEGGGYSGANVGDETDEEEPPARKLARELVAKYGDDYSLLFGSQIELLRMLRSDPMGALPLGQVRRDFDESIAKRFDGKMDWEVWIGFMRTRGLLHVHTGVVNITGHGKRFLEYVDALNLPERPF